MQFPIVSPAPIVEQHAPAFRDLFENHCQFDHFQNKKKPHAGHIGMFLLRFISKCISKICFPRSYK